MPRPTYLLALSLCLALAACMAPGSGRQANLSPLPIEKRHEYIRHSKSTLKQFRLAASDLRLRRKPGVLREFAGEVKRYFDLQVQPVLGDAATGHDLQTRLEVAKLQLLGGLVYVELTEYRQAATLLEQMEERYGTQPEILTAALDRNDIGFPTIGDGLRHLHERIDREDKGLPLSRILTLPGLPRI